MVILRLGAHHATFELARAKLTTRLIEGEFPNYRQLIPSSYPEPADRRPRGAARCLASGQAAGPGPTTPVRIALQSEGIELTVITQDWGQAPKTSTPSTRAPR